MIGILALQGNYQMHQAMLNKIGAENILIRYELDLNQCTGLIIPGGESTTISKMLSQYNLFNSIKRFSKHNSIFGTCAGLVLMSNYDAESVSGLKLIDVDVSRNGWGRQINSFTEEVEIRISKDSSQFEATFIRAPRITRVGESVDILSKFKQEAIMIRQGRHIATTFHPEMHNNPLLHKYFLEIANG